MHILTPETDSPQRSASVTGGEFFTTEEKITIETKTVEREATPPSSSSSDYSQIVNRHENRDFPVSPSLEYPGLEVEVESILQRENRPSITKPPSEVCSPFDKCAEYVENLAISSEEESSSTSKNTDIISGGAKGENLIKTSLFSKFKSLGVNFGQALWTIFCILALAGLDFTAVPCHFVRSKILEGKDSKTAGRKILGRAKHLALKWRNRFYRFLGLKKRRKRPPSWNSSYPPSSNSTFRLSHWKLSNRKIISHRRLKNFVKERINQRPGELNVNHLSGAVGGMPTLRPRGKSVLVPIYKRMGLPGLKIRVGNSVGFALLDSGSLYNIIGEDLVTLYESQFHELNTFKNEMNLVGRGGSKLKIKDEGVYLPVTIESHDQKRHTITLPFLVEQGQHLTPIIGFSSIQALSVDTRVPYSMVKVTESYVPSEIPSRGVYFHSDKIPDGLVMTEEVQHCTEPKCPPHPDFISCTLGKELLKNQSLRESFNDYIPVDPLRYGDIKGGERWPEFLEIKGGKPHDTQGKPLDLMQPQVIRISHIGKISADPSINEDSSSDTSIESGRPSQGIAAGKAEVFSADDPILQADVEPPTNKATDPTNLEEALTDIVREHSHADREYGTSHPDPPVNTVTSHSTASSIVKFVIYLFYPNKNCLLCPLNLCKCKINPADIPRVGKPHLVDNQAYITLPQGQEIRYFRRAFNLVGRRLQELGPNVIILGSKGSELSGLGIKLSGLLNLLISLYPPKPSCTPKQISERSFVTEDNVSLSDSSSSCGYPEDHINHLEGYTDSDLPEVRNKKGKFKEGVTGLPSEILTEDEINIFIEPEGPKEIEESIKNSNSKIGNFLRTIFEVFREVYPRDTNDLGIMKDPNFKLHLTLKDPSSPLPQHQPYPASRIARKACSRIMEHWLESGLVARSNRASHCSRILIVKKHLSPSNFKRVQDFLIKEHNIKIEVQSQIYDLDPDLFPLDLLRRQWRCVVDAKNLNTLTLADAPLQQSTQCTLMELILNMKGNSHYLCNHLEVKSFESLQPPPKNNQDSPFNIPWTPPDIDMARIQKVLISIETDPDLQDNTRQMRYSSIDINAAHNIIELTEESQFLLHVISPSFVKFCFLRCQGGKVPIKVSETAGSGLVRVRVLFKMKTIAQGS